MMAPAKLRDRLNALIHSQNNREGNIDSEPYQEYRIFTNRTLKMSRINAIGFDMDYTLAQYNRAELDKLTMSLTLKAMVKELDYPASILEIPYLENFAIRGLVIDRKLGNVLKMDKFHYVSLAYHGLKQLDTATRSDLYVVNRLNLQGSRYRSVDTLFELLETYLYAAVIERLEESAKIDDYGKIYKDIRNLVDRCHRDDSLKNEVRKDPKRYIEDDPRMIATLHQFKETGKRLFVVTNSEPDYTEFVLSWLFRNAQPFFRSWQHCFDIVGTDARKPLFFKEGQPVEIIDDKETLFFRGGNLDFLETHLGIKGDQVLYVGDHIYGDILKSKHSTQWRTCIIVPELEFQVRAEKETRPYFQKLLKNSNRTKHVTMELHWHRSQLVDLHQFKISEADDLDIEDLDRIDARIMELDRYLESNHKELSRLISESKDLRRKISNTFNPYWGRLFKTGGQLSNFAEQIRDYACLYTSSVSNFNFYGAQARFESMVSPMPHEKNLYSVGDLNFDASLDTFPRTQEALENPREATATELLNE
jgi:HAD superfamily 5'-nucleotidase-like hydrolase